MFVPQTKEKKLFFLKDFTLVKFMYTATPDALLHAAMPLVWPPMPSYLVAFFLEKNNKWSLTSSSIFNSYYYKDSLETRRDCWLLVLFDIEVFSYLLPFDFMTMEHMKLTVE